MDGSEAQQHDLTRPEWFADTAAWWVPALGVEALAARVEPLGVDAQRRLHVLCESPAWRTQLRLLERAVLARLGELVPEAGLTRMLALVRPSVAVLVVATDDFADWPLIPDVLMETCYDVSEAFGPEHQVVLRLLGESEFDHHVANWVEAHRPTTTDTAIRVYATAHPADPAEYGDGAVWARDRT